MSFLSSCLFWSSYVSFSLLGLGFSTFLFMWPGLFYTHLVLPWYGGNPLKCPFVVLESWLDLQLHFKKQTKNNMAEVIEYYFVNQVIKTLASTLDTLSGSLICSWGSQLLSGEAHVARNGGKSLASNQQETDPQFNSIWETEKSCKRSHE